LKKGAAFVVRERNVGTEGKNDFAQKKPGGRDKTEGKSKGDLLSGEKAYALKELGGGVSCDRGREGNRYEERQ